MAGNSARQIQEDFFQNATTKSWLTFSVFNSCTAISCNFYGHHGHSLEHVVPPALSALLFRRSAVPRFSAVSVLVCCLTESSLWSLALIANVCFTFRMIASMTTLYFALLCHMQSQETSSWPSNLYHYIAIIVMDVKSSGTGIGVLTLYHDFMLPSKLAVSWTVRTESGRSG